jgi:hypothetical protein
MTPRRRRGDLLRRGDVQQRTLYWVMVRAERLAQWCRYRWLQRHETRGVVLPGDETPTDGGKPDAR